MTLLVVVVAAVLVVGVVVVVAGRRRRSGYDVAHGRPTEAVAAPEYDTLLHHDAATGLLTFEQAGSVTVHDVRVWVGGDTAAAPDHARASFAPGEQITLPFDPAAHGLPLGTDADSQERFFDLHVELHAAREDGRPERSWWDRVWVE